MSINGVEYDWESVSIIAPNGQMVGVTEISYSDERPIEARYGKGSVPRGYGRGNYKAQGSLTLDRDEYTRLVISLGGGHYTKGRFPINVSYSNDDELLVVDILPDCMITKADTSAKQGDSNVGIVKLDIVILSPIRWNGISAYDENGATGIGLSQLIP